MLTRSNISRRNFLLQGSMALTCGAALSRYAAAIEATGQEHVEVETTYGRIRGLRTNGSSDLQRHSVWRSRFGCTSFQGRATATTLDRRPRRTERRRAFATDSIETLLWNQRGLACGRLPFSECLDPRSRRTKTACHVLQPRRRILAGIRKRSLPGRRRLARTWDVVVVETNHRLGLMGFLYLGDLAGEEYATSGNQGLLDICDGLKWVHQNIGRFGGDPDNVMIFGESGGGAKTSCLYAMPAAAPYFNKASIESGPGIRMMPRDMATETTMMVLKELGLGKADWQKLLEVPGDKLLDIQVALGKRPGGPLTMSGGRKGIGGGGRPGGFGPVVDGTILPHHPFDPEAPCDLEKQAAHGGLQPRRDHLLLHGGP